MTGAGATEAQEADEQQQHSGEQTRDPDAGETVALHEHDQHRGHRAGGTADLKGRAGESTHDETREDGSDQTRGGRGTRSDSERQRKR